MPSEPEKLLITAAIDGELSPEQRPAFRDLLARSEEAGLLFAALQADRDRLRSLARPPAPPQLFSDILAGLPHAIPSERLPARSRRRSVAPLGMAASFLLAVGAGAYWLAVAPNTQRVAKNQLQQLPKDDARLSPPDRPMPLTGDEQTDDELPEPMRPAVAPVPPSTVVASNDPPKPPVDLPDTKPSDWMAAPAIGSDVKAFDRVAVKLPLLVPFAELAHDDTRTALRDRLGQNTATRIDLFAKDSARAVELLTQAGRGVNLNVIVETIAGERMKRKMPSTWFLFTDSLTAAEATTWLSAAAGADAKAASPSGTVFGPAHVLSATGYEQKEVQQLLAVDLGLGKKVADPQPNAHISAKTLDQVTTAIQKGDAAKPAILLTYLPPLVRVHPALSKDVKQFHELRKDRKPGTVPLLIVIRATAG